MNIRKKEFPFLTYPPKEKKKKRDDQLLWAV
jgi:hypothetical protein